MVSPTSSSKRISSSLNTGRRAPLAPAAANACAPKTLVVVASPSALIIVASACLRFIITRLLDIALVEFIYGIVHGARGQGHISQGRVLTRGGGHAGTVGNKDI